MSILTELAASDLRALSAAIRAGRLRPPYSSIAVGRLVGTMRGDVVSRALTQFVEAGASDAALAMFLDTLTVSMGRQRPLEDLVEVVTTGPEVSDGRDTGIVVQDLFRRARKTVLVSGYKLYDARGLFSELANRLMADEALRVRMFLDVGSEDPLSEKDAVRAFVRDFRRFHWPGACRVPEVFYDPRTVSRDPAVRAVLHAKCVVVDETELFVSSANFTEAAQARNIEVGLLVQSGNLAKEVTGFYEALVRKGHLRQVRFWEEGVA
ncbi:MAG: hypothetical protein JNK87_42840 [Bryobacterales bacterium]|nr:hypothetical protein [Bryobacterales bacterium]